MQIWFVVSLIFSLIIAAFAAMNSDVVTIRLIFAKYELSQSLVIIISAAVGAIIAILFGIFSKIKTAMKVRELNSEIKTSKAKIDELNDIIKKNEVSLAVAKAASQTENVKENIPQ